MDCKACKANRLKQAHRDFTPLTETGDSWTNEQLRPTSPDTTSSAPCAKQEGLHRHPRFSLMFQTIRASTGFRHGGSHRPRNHAETSSSISANAMRTTYKLRRHLPDRQIQASTQRDHPITSSSACANSAIRPSSSASPADLGVVRLLARLLPRWLLSWA